MMKTKAAAFFLFSLFFVSQAESLEKLTLTKEKWKSLKFDRIPGNVVEFETDRIKVKVDSGAGPLIYPFSEAKIIKGISIKGVFDGSLKPLVGDFDEDSQLRVGFVLAGSRVLNFFTKKLAADWVLKLYDLAPKGSGIDHIYFINTTARSQVLGRTRVHPNSELIKEDWRWKIEEGQRDYAFQHSFERSLKVYAIWLSIDGDDTKSRYSNTITEIGID